MSLHEKYLKGFDYSEHHELGINAPAEMVADCVRSANFSDSFLVNLLTRLRGIRRSRGGIESLSNMGFVLLENDPSKEVIFGLVGQFWKPSGNIVRMAGREAFERFNDTGYLKATWNFAIRETGDRTSCVLETETRIRCLGPEAKRKFARYWFFVRPFSGLIRMQMLRSIRRTAESVRHGKSVQ